MSWVCYLLYCADETLYCGITNDLDKRVAAHNAGTAAKYTRARGPVRVAYMEACADRSTASKREMAIKKLSRESKLILVQSWSAGVSTCRLVSDCGTIRG
jgi:putative endonuclease